VEGVDSYIDQALIGGVLTGVLLLLGVLWLLYAQNALWRLHIAEQAEPALSRLEERFRLQRQAKGFGPWVRSRGSIGPWEVMVELSGGVRGPRARLRAVAGRKVIRSERPLEVVLSGLDVWLVDSLDLRHEE